VVFVSFLLHVCKVMFSFLNFLTFFSPYFTVKPVLEGSFVGVVFTVCLLSLHCELTIYVFISNTKQNEDVSVCK